ncbi:MAG: 50S ribosomal protein L11 methyltransferase [Nitrospirae bacterium]|nr:50S ribosomal protein L11 methyltransferase [Magnetococcales bacterium]HAT50885.1 50S ribosomal protein L11 methyltransferase [Alphaproteobacteria bacterium]
MVWEVQLLAPEGCEEACSEILAAAGSMGSVMEWAPEVGARVKVKGYFSEEIQRDDAELRVQLSLAAAQMPWAAHAMVWQHLPDQDWAEAWKKDLKPMAVGQRFLISPSWWPKEKTSRIQLTIDPGLAFGSGSHETTSGCLEAMEWVCEKTSLGAFLDMGCGSGILAMGAVLLGAQPVIASDLDPQAIMTCRENCQLNAIDTVTTVLSEAVPVGPFNTIVANILSGVLIDKSSDLADQLVPGGRLILAGLLDHQSQEVLAAYSSRGMLAEKIIPKNSWVILVMVKP